MSRASTAAERRTAERKYGMILETERLVLRPWNENDAEDLYTYAKDPAVGPIAGWPPHKSVGESLDVIRNVLNGKEAYAVCLREDLKAIGAIELKLNGHTDMTEKDDECELGYWTLVSTGSGADTTTGTSAQSGSRKR